MRIAVVQHKMRSHQRQDLAALLTGSEKACEQDAQVVLYPFVPGVTGDVELIDAFFRNVSDHCPGLAWVSPGARWVHGNPLECRSTALGRTLILLGDDCIDPGLFAQIQAVRCEALVWLFTAEDELQAEAILELALEASLTLSPLVVIASSVGSARGYASAGQSAIVHLGEIICEGGPDEDLLVAELPVPAVMVERPRRVPEPTTVLVQRLSAHRHEKAPVDYPADLS